MAEKTGIAWADATFNPWWGCTRVSRACKFCYADLWAEKRGKAGLWGQYAPRLFFGERHWNEPLAWNRAALRAGERRRVFCASMSDVFELLPPKHPQRGEMDEARERLWALIAETPWLDWLLLTKRPGQVQRLAPWGNDWPRNVQLGTSVEDDRWAQKRVPLILSVPAWRHFVSYEPAVGAVRWRPEWFRRVAGGFLPELDFAVRPDGYTTRIDWLIAGGESGSAEQEIEPIHPDWARAARDACERHGAAFFFKQWGNFLPWEPDAQPPLWNSQNGRCEDGHGLLPDWNVEREAAVWNDGLVHLEETPAIFQRVKTKAAAGDLLDGRQWQEFPTSAAPAPVVRRALDTRGAGNGSELVAGGTGTAVR